MSRLARMQSAEEDHYQSSVFCEELEAKLNLTAQSVVTIWKLLHKEGYDKGGHYNWPILMVQLILEQLVNGKPPENHQTLRLRRSLYSWGGSYCAGASQHQLYPVILDNSSNYW